MTYAAKGYFDALVKMGELASESQGSKELGKTPSAAETPGWLSGCHTCLGGSGVPFPVWSCFHWGRGSPCQTRSFSERTVTSELAKAVRCTPGCKWGVLGSFGVLLREHTGGSVPPKKHSVG